MLTEWGNIGMVYECIKLSFELKLYDHIGTGFSCVKDIATRAETDEYVTSRYVIYCLGVCIIYCQSCLNGILKNSLVYIAHERITSLFILSNIIWDYEV